MANTLRGGFHPVGGHSGRAATRYEVASSYGTALFRGDIVTLVTAGTVEAATAGGAPLILGAVKEVSYVVSGKRVFDTYLPATTVYSPTARGSVNATYVWVYDDPATEYWVCLASHAGTDTEAEVHATIGANMDLVATAGSTVYRQSGHTLDGNPIAGTAQFRIREIRRIPGRAPGDANLQVRVAINEGFHPFHSAAGI